MRRDFRALAGGPFDLLVVGGGIYGAWTAYDAALRGLRVALVEKDDWASGTSSGSSKLIHGGLRYLESLRFGLVRAGLDERRRLWRLGPHRVHPLRFAVPLYAGDRVGRLRMGLGLWLYDRLAGAGQPVGPHRFAGREELLRELPLGPAGLAGGFVYGDCGTDDARLTLEIVCGAGEAGAVAVHRARATSLVVERGRVAGARVEDRLTGESVEVRAAVTACCTGAWSTDLCGPAGDVPLRLTKGVHLVLPSLGTDLALLLPSNDDRRVVFVLPWYGRTLLGTTDTDYDGDPDAVRVEARDVGYLLDLANRALGGVRWRRSDVLGSSAALRTFPRTSAAAPSSLSREWVVARPRAGLLVSVGGKLTSARADAAALVDRVFDESGRRAVPCATAERPLPWCPAGAFDGWTAGAVLRARSAGLDEETARCALSRHGARIDAVLARIESDPGLARRIVPDAPFCRAEVVHAVAAEMALDLQDVLRRRVPLALVARIPGAALRDAADLAGRVLGWTAARREREIADFAAAGNAPETDLETA
jgi:glycerol-3-phosphate dehydrogenase